MHNTAYIEYSLNRLLFTWHQVTTYSLSWHHFITTKPLQANLQLCLTWRERSTNSSCLDVIPDSQNYHENKFRPLGTESQYFELCLCTWCCLVSFVFFKPSRCVWTTGYFTHSCSKSNVTVLWGWKNKRHESRNKNYNTVSTTNDCTFFFHFHNNTSVTTLLNIINRFTG